MGGLFWLVAARANKVLLAATGLVAGILTGLMIKVAGRIYYDPRPFALHHTQPLLKHTADNGFPSDHTALAAIAALTVFQVSRKMGLIMLALAMVLGISRVAAQIHSPIDIVGSLAIGTLSVAIATPIARRLVGAKVELV